MRQQEQIIIMDRGKVMIDGTPAQVFSRQDEVRAMNMDVPFVVELAAA